VNGPLRRAAWAILAAFLVLALTATWVQAVAAPRYRDDPRNPRLVAWRVGKERGAIVTADDVVAARSDPDPEDPQVFRRSYPEGDLYAHTVGFASVLFGARGLEQERSGDLVSDRDSTISGVLNALLGGDPRPRGLRLTLEHDLQEAAETALDGQSGAILAIDPATGEILASVSTPGFDPNELIGPGAGPAGSQLQNDPDEPLLDRTIARTYPPGSSFKVVTAAAALEAGVAGPSTDFDDPIALQLPGSSSTISNYDDEVCNDGTSVTLEHAFVRSCNTVFADLGMQVGADRLVAMAEAFGFNQDIPYDLGVLDSAIPDAGTFEDNLPAVAQNAIGQRDVRSTPMQMALVAAAIANDGEIMIPHVVGDVFTSDGTVVESTEPTVWQRAVSPATAGVLTDLMERAVISGTGQRASVPGVRIAGKTGTAQVTGAAPHAWFIGFGPVEPGPGERQIALAVVVESGGDAGETATGGSVAAPIASRVFEEFFGD
jgi:peptidoglycan glycosyltransferase